MSPHTAPVKLPSDAPARPAAHRTIVALMLREMSTTYGRTPGGYLWAIAEPVAALMVLSIGFSLVLRTPPIGNSFLLFYASGYLPFSLYVTIQNTVSRSINFSRPLLRYPAVSWMDALLARFLLNGITNLTVAIIVFVGVLAVQDTGISLQMGTLALSFFMAAMIGLGAATINCVLFGLYPLWEMVWGIISRPLLIASGILYLVDDLPQLAQDILWFNPLVHVTSVARDAVYGLNHSDYVSLPYVFGLSFGGLTLGLLFLRRFYREILNA